MQCWRIPEQQVFLTSVLCYVLHLLFHWHRSLIMSMPPSWVYIMLEGRIHALFNTQHKSAERFRSGVSQPSDESDTDQLYPPTYYQLQPTESSQFFHVDPLRVLILRWISWLGFIERDLKPYLWIREQQHPWHIPYFAWAMTDTWCLTLSKSVNKHVSFHCRELRNGCHLDCQGNSTSS